MDGSRFDRFARSLVTGTSRRGVLGGLLGLGAGLAGLRAAEAATCPPGRVYRRGVGCVCRLTGRPPVGGVCPCPRGQTDTGDGLGCLECPSVKECPASDPCSSVACDPSVGCVTTPVPDNAPDGCAAGSVCCAGRGCTPLGTASDCTACGDGCADPTPLCNPTLGCVACLKSDHCGPCQTCDNGACVVDGSSEAQPCPSTGEFGAICCGGACVDLPDDQDHLCCGTGICQP
jgi:hypothetical protein